MTRRNRAYLGGTLVEVFKRNRGVSRNEFTHDGLRCAEGPVSEWCGPFLGKAVLNKNSGVRGPGWRGEALQRWLISFEWATSTEGAFMNLMEELKGNYDEADKLWSSYKERLTAFRSEVKNDVASLEASARKTTEAVHRMTKAYGDVITQLNSLEMQQAVTNAERLAAALASLAQLQSQKLVFAVTDQTATEAKS